jgi:flagellar biosynthesis chaperone FliJ
MNKRLKQWLQAVPARETYEHDSRVFLAIDKLEDMERELAYLRQYEDRGDFVVYRDEWKALHRTIDALNRKIERMENSLETARQECKDPKIISILEEGLFG